MNQPGKWSYPVYDSYPGYGDPDTVGPQDVPAAGLLNAAQNPLRTQYTFQSLSADTHVCGTACRPPRKQPGKTKSGPDKPVRSSDMGPGSTMAGR